MSPLGVSTARLKKHKNKMSLIARKNIKEVEAELANAKKGLQEVLGAVELVPEFDKFLKCADIKADDLKFIGGYVLRHANTIKDETKSYFNNAVAKKIFADNVAKIIITPGELSQKNNHEYSYEATDKSLVLKVKPDALAYGLSYQRPVQDLLNATFKYSFLRNCEAANAGAEEKIKKIKAALGDSWTVNLNLAAIYDKVPEGDRPHLPEYIMNRHLSQVVSDMEAIGKDEMAKEVFLEKVSDKVIEFAADESIKASSAAAFEGAKYVYKVKPSMIAFGPQSQKNWIMENL